MLTHLLDRIELQVERVKIAEIAAEFSERDERIWFDEPIELADGVTVRGMDADELIIEQDGIPTTTKNIFDLKLDEEPERIKAFLKRLLEKVEQFRDNRCQKLKT